MSTLVWTLPQGSVQILESNPVALMKWIQCRPIPGKFPTTSEHLEEKFFLEQFWTASL